jgi:hypothetical protein
MCTKHMFMFLARNLSYVLAVRIHTEQEVVAKDKNRNIYNVPKR